jgi:aromatic-L-amino-acid decarboxylase
VLARHRSDLEAALAHEEAYIPHDRLETHMVDITLEYSRPFRALKLWLAFRVHGVEAIREAIEQNLAQARLMYDLVRQADDLEAVCGPPDLTIVPFRHVPAGVDDLNDHNARLVQALQADGRVWIAPARVGDVVCLRPCFVNFRTTDDDVRALVEIACEVGEALVS